MLNQDSGLGYLIAFHRLSEGIFEHIGDFTTFVAGEIAIKSINVKQEVLIACIGLEIIDIKSRIAKIEPMIFHRYIVEQDGRYNIANSFTLPDSECIWKPTKLDLRGLLAEFHLLNNPEILH